MKTVAIVSAAGGAGRTTVTAELAALLQQRNHPTLALECDPRGALGQHFGMREIAASGLAGPGDWAAAGLRSDDGVLFVPWGCPADENAVAGRLLAEPQWLRRLLAQVDLPANGIALVDTPPWPSVHAAQALEAADLVLALVPPLPDACATLGRLHKALEALGKPCAFVNTRLRPALALHADIATLMRAMLGRALLPYSIHEDIGLPDALARGENFCRGTPHSQAAHDLHGLASWVSRWMGAAGKETAT